MNARDDAARQMRRDGFTLQEVGTEFGISRERVRQITRGVSSGRDIQRALPLYAPIEVTIENPWGVKELCQRCLRSAEQETPWGPACAACASTVWRHNDPEYRERQDQAISRYNSGPCPRPTPRCKKWYRNIWQHILGFKDHAEDYAEIYAELRRARVLPPRPAPPRRRW